MDRTTAKSSNLHFKNKFCNRPEFKKRIDLTKQFFTVRTPRAGIFMLDPKTRNPMKTRFENSNKTVASGKIFFFGYSVFSGPPGPFQARRSPKYRGVWRDA